MSWYHVVKYYCYYYALFSLSSTECRRPSRTKRTPSSRVSYENLKCIKSFPIKYCPRANEPSMSTSVQEPGAELDHHHHHWRVLNSLSRTAQSQPQHHHRHHQLVEVRPCRSGRQSACRNISNTSPVTTSLGHRGNEHPETRVEPINRLNSQVGFTYRTVTAAPTRNGRRSTARECGRVKDVMLTRISKSTLARQPIPNTVVSLSHGISAECGKLSRGSPPGCRWFAVTSHTYLHR